VASFRAVLAVDVWQNFRFGREACRMALCPVGGARVPVCEIRQQRSVSATISDIIALLLVA